MTSGCAWTNDSYMDLFPLLLLGVGMVSLNTNTSFMILYITQGVQGIWLQSENNGDFLQRVEPNDDKQVFSEHLLGFPWIHEIQTQPLPSGHTGVKNKQPLTCPPCVHTFPLILTASRPLDLPTWTDTHRPSEGSATSPTHHSHVHATLQCTSHKSLCTHS